MLYPWSSPLLNSYTPIKKNHNLTVLFFNFFYHFKVLLLCLLSWIVFSEKPTLLIFISLYVRYSSIPYMPLWMFPFLWFTAFWIYYLLVFIPVGVHWSSWTYDMVSVILENSLPLWLQLCFLFCSLFVLLWYSNYKYIF